MIAQPARKIRSFALTITMLSLISACGSQRVETPGPQRSRVQDATYQNAGEKAASVALRQVGVPYRYGGNTVSGFDCSGLVQFSYSRAGRDVARTTGQLWSSSAPVPREELQVGDLLFFNIEGKMSHVGLYIGDQRFVHAPSSGQTVSVASLRSAYYAKAFIRGGRP